MTRTQIAKVFEKHQLTVVENTESVQMFVCRKPGTGVYGFQVVCADNVICLTGDIYSLLVEPGYGRNGTKFLRGSIESESYFLSKVRFGKDDLDEFTVDKAREALKYEREQYADSPDVLRLLDKAEEGLQEDGKYGHMKFCEAWYEAGLDDMPNVLTLRAQVEFQLEALKWLSRELDRIGFINGTHPIPKRWGSSSWTTRLLSRLKRWWSSIAQNAGVAATTAKTK